MIPFFSLLGSPELVALAVLITLAQGACSIIRFLCRAYEWLRMHPIRRKGTK